MLSNDALMKEASDASMKEAASDAFLWHRLLNELYNSNMLYEHESKSKVFQAIQYHPFYNRLMSAFNKFEQRLSYYHSRPCFLVLSGSFIPIKIRETIFSRYRYSYLFRTQLSISSKKADLNLHVITRQPWSDAALLDALNQVKLILLTVWTVYSIKESTRPVNIFFYPTKFKKQLLKSNHLDPDVLTFLKSEAGLVQRKGYKIGIDNYATTTSVSEVNSAMCYRGHGIVIWREEDWTSRLCHELIHFYELEKVQLPDLSKRFSINNQILVNPGELVTETQTYFLWTVFRAVQNNADRDQIDKWICEDRLYQVAMAYRFCDWIGLTLRHDNVNSSLNNTVVNINSNAFYYYILRGCFWIKIDETVLDLVIPNRNITSDRLGNNLLGKIKIFNDLHANVSLKTCQKTAPVPIKMYADG